MWCHCWSWKTLFSKTYPIVAYFHPLLGGIWEKFHQIKLFHFYSRVAVRATSFLALEVEFSVTHNISGRKIFFSFLFILWSLWNISVFVVVSYFKHSVCIMGRRGVSFTIQSLHCNTIPLQKTHIDKNDINRNRTLIIVFEPVYWIRSSKWSQRTWVVPLLTALWLWNCQFSSENAYAQSFSFLHSPSILQRSKNTRSTAFEAVFFLSKIT